MATDPVCGMTIEPDKAAGTTTYQGQTYWFCSAHCLAKFKADPAKYGGGKNGGSRQSPLQAFLKKLKFGRG